MVRIIFFPCCGWGRVARLPGTEGGNGRNKKRTQKEEEMRGKYCRNGHGGSWVGGGLRDRQYDSSHQCHTPEVVGLVHTSLTTKGQL